jgi:hypothetical protein
MSEKCQSRRSVLRKISDSFRHLEVGHRPVDWGVKPGVNFVNDLANQLVANPSKETSRSYPYSSGCRTVEQLP